MHEGASLPTTCTFRELFVEVSAWLINPKAITDLAFVLAFNAAWWDREMKFCQGIGPWQAGVSAERKRVGYRADEMSVHVVFARMRLEVRYILILFCV